MPDQTVMYYVAFCRVCKTGPVGVRSCGSCGKVALLCDECDAVWADAHLAAPPLFASVEELPCPHCGASLAGGASRWAGVEAIHDTPWLREALESGALELRHGAAWRIEGDQS